MARRSAPPATLIARAREWAEYVARDLGQEPLGESERGMLTAHLFALADACEGLERALERERTCVVCEATLAPIPMPHCLDCVPTEEHREAWEETS
jgi:hypothetical protein